LHATHNTYTLDTQVRNTYTLDLHVVRLALAAVPQHCGISQPVFCNLQIHEPALRSQRGVEDSAAAHIMIAKLLRYLFHGSVHHAYAKCFLLGSYKNLGPVTVSLFLSSPNK
jgi:hypothetical protein